MALLAVATWNICATVQAETVGGSAHTGLWFLLGLLQIAWGVESLKRHRRFSGITLQRPDPDTAKQLEEMVMSIIAQDLAEAGDLIAFREKRFPKVRCGEPDLWKTR